MKTCDHCGTPAKRRYAVRITKRGHTKVAMVGSSCAKHFPRANQSDLIRSLGYDQNHDAAVYDDLLAKYPDHKEGIEAFKRTDPSGKMKYLRWQVDLLVENVALAPEIIDVTRLFHRFSARLDKKDIFQWRADQFTELRDKLFAFEALKAQKEKKVEERYRMPESCDVGFVYESQRFTIVLIKNKAASVHYGLGTKWCITEKMRSYFEDYDTNNDVFFFIMDKTIGQDNPLYKIASQYSRQRHNQLEGMQFWDAENKRTMGITIKEHMGEEYEAAHLAMSRAAMLHPQSMLSKIKTGAASKEEIKEAFQDIITWTDESKKNYALSILSKKSDTPIELLVLIAKTKIAELAAIAKARAASQGTLTEKQDEGRESIYSILGSIAENYNANATIARVFIKSGDDRLLEALLGGPNVSTSVLEVLSNSDEYYVRQRVAEHKNTPAHVIARLSNDRQQSVRVSVARSSSTNKALLRVMASDPSAYVRIALARNERLPPNILNQWLKFCVKNKDVLTDEQREVCSALAENSQMTKKQFEYLALTGNREILRSMAGVYNTDVKDVIEKISETCSKEVKEAIICGPNMNEKMMERFAKDPDVGVREKLAEQWSLPEPIYEMLANDESPDVRKAIAAGRNTPVTVLSRLSADSDGGVREAAGRKERSSVGSSAEEEFKRKQREDWQRIANQIEAEGRIQLGSRAPGSDSLEKP